MSTELSRRSVLGMGVGAFAASLLGGCVSGNGATPARSTSGKRVLRVAHLTDSHIQPERGGGEGVQACLRHVMKQAKCPDMIITGGDQIMDSFEHDGARTRELWDLYTRVVKDECPLTFEHTIGNHDIWGWNKAKSSTTGNEPMWGKRWVCDLFGYERPYRAFDRGNWRFVILDSVQPRGDSGYTGYVDDVQMEWLRAQLASAGASKHVCIVSHIPILGLAPVVRDAKIENGDWTVAGGVMHSDGQALAKLFKETGNVRLCLSGHIHKLDRCEYEGTTYICGGAVSGAWWRGTRDRVVEGYGLVDFYDDGRFDYSYNQYGWVAYPDPQTT